MMPIVTALLLPAAAACLFLKITNMQKPEAQKSMLKSLDMAQIQMAMTWWRHLVRVQSDVWN